MVKSCAAYNCSERFKKGSSLSFHQFPTNPELRKMWIIATKRYHFNPSKYTYLCSKHFDPSCFDTERLGGLIVLKNNAIPTHFDYDSSDENSISPKNVATIKTDGDDDGPSTSFSHVLCTEWSTLEESSSHSSTMSPISPYKIDEPLRATKENASFNSPYRKATKTKYAMCLLIIKIMILLKCSSEGLLQSSSTITASEIEEYLRTPPKEKKKSRFRHPRYVGDCSTDDMEFPTIARRNWKIAKHTIVKQKQQIKLLQQNKRRLQFRILSLKCLMKEHFRKCRKYNSSKFIGFS